MTEADRAIAASAQKHGLSEAAGRVLWDALVAGRGGQAQFSHPELGGMGQWSGGMTQIGDMFNHGLKARVAAFCADLAPLATRSNASGSAASFQTQHQGAAPIGRSQFLRLWQSGCVVARRSWPARVEWRAGRHALRLFPRPAPARGRTRRRGHDLRHGPAPHFRLFAAAEHLFGAGLYQPDRTRDAGRLAHRRGLRPS